MTHRTLILDTTLTDGFNSSGLALTTEDKLAVAMQLQSVGVDIIEVGYPRRSAGDFAGVIAVSQMVKQAVIAARSRMNQGEIDSAYEALQSAAQPRIKLSVPTSPAFVRYVLKMDELTLLEAVDAAVRYARTKVADVQFTAEDATRTEWSFLAKICSTAAAAGASTVVIQDSVGLFTPKEFYDIIRYLREQSRFLEQAALGVDCRHDLGLALANALGALERGVEQIDCSIGGVGFPLGLVPLEALVTAIHSRPDRYPTSINVRPEQLHRLSDLTQRLTGARGVLWGRVLRDAAASQQAGDLMEMPQASGTVGPYRLQSFQMMTNEDGDCTANVVLLTREGIAHHGSAAGNSQVEALYHAIAQAAGGPGRLVDHAINHIRQDWKAALVWLEDGGRVVTGRGGATTVLRASGDAYVDALGQLVSTPAASDAE